MPLRPTARFSRYLRAKKLHGILPKMTLCDECKVLGYCKASISDNFLVKPEITRSTNINRSFDISEYTGRIPFRVDAKLGLSEFAKIHLQTAYDAFHQDDFETALLHFKSVTVGGFNYLNADYFFALSYFMLGDYQMSNSHMQACFDNTFLRDKDFDAFLDECCRRSISSEVLEELDKAEESLFEVLLSKV